MIDRLAGQNINSDANVFISAVEGHDTFASPAQELLAFVETGTANAFTSELTLAEVLVGPIRENNRKLVGDYEGLLGGQTAPTVLPVTRLVFREAANFRAMTRQKLPDAIHVATASLASCRHFISEDAGLKIPAGIQHTTRTQLIATWKEPLA